MKILTIALILIPTILTGCAHKYQKFGAQPGEFQRAKTSCLVSASQAGYTGGDFASNIARGRFINECMEGQGWEKI